MTCWAFTWTAPIIPAFHATYMFHVKQFDPVISWKKKKRNDPKEEICFT
jgi:hypothetical protein